MLENDDIFHLFGKTRFLGINVLTRLMRSVSARLRRRLPHSRRPYAGL